VTKVRQFKLSDTLLFNSSPSPAFIGKTSTHATQPSHSNTSYYKASGPIRSMHTRAGPAHSGPLTRPTSFSAVLAVIVSRGANTPPPKEPACSRAGDWGKRRVRSARFSQVANPSGMLDHLINTSVLGVEPIGRRRLCNTRSGTE
jgi:hypothetical protein